MRFEKFIHNAESVTRTELFMRGKLSRATELFQNDMRPAKLSY